MMVASSMAVSLGHTKLARAYLELGPKEALAFLHDEIGYERTESDV